MANTFLLSSHSYEGRKLSLSCTQVENIGENRSKILWTLTVAGGSAKYYSTGPTTVKIGDEVVYSAPYTGWSSYKFPAGKGSVSGTVEVPHNSDGTLSLLCSITTAIYTSVQQTREALWELNSIPRAGTIGATDAYVGAVSMVAVDRKNAAYTHTIAYSFGQLNGYLRSDGSTAQEPVFLETTSVAFLLPEEFYDQIPNDVSAICTLTCTTYYGTEVVGEPTQAAFAVMTREADCKPLVSGTVCDCNEATLALTGDENVLVRFFSRARCEILAQPRKSAAILQKQIAGQPVEESLEISDVETGSFTFAAVDSRGYTADCTANLQVVPYIKLTANGTARRAAPTQNDVYVEVFGNVYTGSFGAQDNTLQVQCNYAGGTVPLEVTLGEGSYFAQGIVPNLPYTQAHSLEIVAADKLMEAKTLLIANPGIPVFDWGERDFRVNGDFSVTGNMRDKYGHSVENGIAVQETVSIDPNTCLQAWIRTDHPNGPGGLCYIQTTFDGEKTLQSNRMQLAVDSNGTVFNRCFSQGAWSPWIDSKHSLGDYIVQCGTEGIWTWEKWHSGKAVCWGKKDKISNISFSTSAEGGYGIYYYNTGSWTFPVGLFTDAPIVSFAFAGEETNAFAWGDKITAAGIGNSYIGRGTNKKGSGTPSVYAVGRWK